MNSNQNVSNREKWFLIKIMCCPLLLSHTRFKIEVKWFFPSIFTEKSHLTYNFKCLFSFTIIAVHLQLTQNCENLREYYDLNKKILVPFNLKLFSTVSIADSCLMQILFWDVCMPVIMNRAWLTFWYENSFSIQKRVIITFIWYNDEKQKQTNAHIHKKTRNLNIEMKLCFKKKRVICMHVQCMNTFE